MLNQPRKKLVVKVKGGLGNQLFCYAAAKRLSHINNCDLVVDHISGFARDRKYKREYELGNFTISSRLANNLERMEPMGRLRRSISKSISKKKHFEDRRYIFQEQTGFDKRLLNMKISQTSYIEGFWQSEKYFHDIEDVIKDEFNILGDIPHDYRQMENAINNKNAVMMHVRWFNAKNSNTQSSNMSKNYYKNAIEHMSKQVQDPTFFLFSDDIDAAYANYKDFKVDLVPVSNYLDNTVPHLDLWAMSLCKHHILANSTFSWWGAWLSKSTNKTVICPKIKMQGGDKYEASWNFDGLIPESWIKM